jgi:predicted Zn-dependent protease
MTRALARFVPIGLVATMAIVAPTATIPAGSSSRIIDDPEDCQEFVPESIGYSGVTDEGKTVALDVRVLLDLDEGVEIEQLRREAEAEPDPALRAEKLAEVQAMHQEQIDRATGLIDAAIGSYAPFDIDFKMTGFEFLQPLKADGTPRNRTVDAQAIIDLAKQQFGGQRPPGSDVVYVLTDLDIMLPSLGNIVAGLADCIGGVRYPNRAFAVGEISESIPIGPVTFYYEATAKIAAHEIGHLLGAHHHYQNCVEGIPSELVEAGEPSPCTLMTNAVDFQSLNFGQIEGLVVRGHAVDFADGPAS